MRPPPPPLLQKRTKIKRSKVGFAVIAANGSVVVAAAGAIGAVYP